MRQLEKFSLCNHMKFGTATNKPANKQTMKNIKSVEKGSKMSTVVPDTLVLNKLGFPSPFSLNLGIKCDNAYFISSLSPSSIQPESSEVPPTCTFTAFFFFFWFEKTIISISNTIDCNEDGCLNRGERTKPGAREGD